MKGLTIISQISMFKFIFMAMSRASSIAEKFLWKSCFCYDCRHERILRKNKHVFHYYTLEKPENQKGSKS